MDVNTKPLEQITTATDLLNELLEPALSHDAPACFAGLELEVIDRPTDKTAARVIHLADGQQYVVRVRRMKGGSVGHGIR